jgi:predicted MFS family arabinose efflux permease
MSTPDFTRLLRANAASQWGTRIGAIAIPLIAVDSLSASTWDMGLLNAVQNLGVLLVGLPAGAWVDRTRRRRLMLATDLARATVLASVPIAALLGELRLALLYAVAVIVSVSGTFFDIAQQTYVPSLVGRDGLLAANARLQASQSIAVAAGPGLGGALVSLLGAANTVVATCFTFVASFLELRRIRHVEPNPERGDDPHLLAEIAAGLRFVLADRVLRAIALCTASTNLFMAVLAGLAVLFLSRIVHLPPVGVGLVLACSGVGGVLGALTVRRLTAVFGQSRVIWLSMLLTQPFGLLLPWAAGGARLTAFVLGWLVLGYGGTVYNISQVSYRQGHCPARLLGRVQASNRFLAWGTLPLGGLLGGALGTWLGVRGALLVAAVGLIASTGWLSWSPLPGQGRRNRPVAAQPGMDFDPQASRGERSRDARGPGGVAE